MKRGGWKPHSGSLQGGRKITFHGPETERLTES